jgi:hypothetical protein
MERFRCAAVRTRRVNRAAALNRQRAFHPGMSRAVQGTAPQASSRPAEPELHARDAVSQRNSGNGAILAGVR